MPYVPFIYTYILIFISKPLWKKWKETHTFFDWPSQPGDHKVEQTITAKGITETEISLFSFLSPPLFVWITQLNHWGWSCSIRNSKRIHFPPREQQHGDARAGGKQAGRWGGVGGGRGGHSAAIGMPLSVAFSSFSIRKATPPSGGQFWLFRRSNTVLLLCCTRNANVQVLRAAVKCRRWQLARTSSWECGSACQDVISGGSVSYKSKAPTLAFHIRQVSSHLTPRTLNRFPYTSGFRLSLTLSPFSLFSQTDSRAQCAEKATII